MMDFEKLTKKVNVVKQSSVKDEGVRAIQDATKSPTKETKSINLTSVCLSVCQSVCVRACVCVCVCVRTCVCAYLYNDNDGVFNTFSGFWWRL